MKLFSDIKPDLKQTKIGVIGAGWAAEKFHLPYYRKHSDLVIEAVADYDKEKREELAAEYNIKNCYETTQELLNYHNVDIISICTPPSSHEEIALQALESGSHVFCEKPLTTSLSSAKRIKKAKSPAEVFFVGYTPKFYSNYQIIKNTIDEGLLGDIHSCKSLYHSPDPPSDWHFNPETSGGGVISDKLPHLLDYYIDVFGVAREIRHKNIEYDRGSPVRATAKIEMSSATVDFSIGWGHPTFYSNQVIIGEYGHIEFDNTMIEGEIRGKPIRMKYGQTPQVDLRLKQLYLSDEDDAYENRMNAFLESVAQQQNIANTTVSKGISIWECIESLEG